MTSLSQDMGNMLTPKDFSIAMEMTSKKLTKKRPPSPHPLLMIE